MTESKSGLDPVLLPRRLPIVLLRRYHYFHTSQVAHVEYLVCIATVLNTDIRGGGREREEDERVVFKADEGSVCVLGSTIRLDCGLISMVA